MNGSDLSSIGNSTAITWRTQLRLFGCSGSWTFKGSLSLYFSENGGDTTTETVPPSDDVDEFPLKIVLPIVLIFVLIVLAFFIYRKFYTRRWTTGAANDNSTIAGFEATTRSPMAPTVGAVVL